MKLTITKQKIKETKDKKKKREQKPKPKQRQGQNIKQKVVINLGNLTRKRRPYNKKVSLGRPSDKLGVHYIETIKSDNKDVLAQLNRQEAETKKLNESSKYLLTLLNNQEDNYKHTMKQLTNDVRDAIDVKNMYPKMIDYHLKNTPLIPKQETFIPPKEIPIAYIPKKIPQIPKELPPLNIVKPKMTKKEAAINATSIRSHRKRNKIVQEELLKAFKTAGAQNE